MVDGTRVSKADPRMVAVGMVDGLNSMVGVCIMEVARLPSIHPDGGPMTHADRLKEHLLVKLRRRQHELFDLGAELRARHHRFPRGWRRSGRRSRTASLRRWNRRSRTCRTSRALHPSNRPSPRAFLHMVRTLARDLERHLVTLREHHGFDVRPVILQYVNRLSLAFRPRSSYHAWPRWDGIVVGPQIQQEGWACLPGMISMVLEEVLDGRE